ncbi:MAG: thymidylate kinase [Rhizobiales bacterium NRL2]|mgnify:CR=1 FL=1|jgi:hypothetical protein|nr:MAG: thymidylate kinase [Rhizobiales bacterium NRL2]
MTLDLKRNNLDQSTSPYLLQHRDNPVHWQMWSAEVLEAAAAEDKPILLSVGYAACHWCHVMAHESFESEAIAGLMNELFVNIKVDREERPDIDTIYMTALHMLGEQGGWPLTMFLTPDGKPFWGGTYFPPESRWGRPGFPDVLQRIREVYDEDKDTIAKNTEALTTGLRENAMLEIRPDRPQIAPNVLDQVGQRLLQEVDSQHGGIGGAPKFPQVPAFELLWRMHLRTGDINARHAVLNTLARMAQGGIYDHLGGGFARYSVDAEWLVPHFEKMLYDNSALITLMSQVWRKEGLPLLEQRVRETAEWVLREMIAANGAFAASLDADSEGVEGKFYVWDESEIDAVLGPEAALFKDFYDITPDGNFEGKNIPNRRLKPDLLDAETEARLAAARTKLLAKRAERVRPAWDDKVLADWNGMMIAALVEAGLTFGERAWIEAAQRAFAAVVKDMQAESGRLFHAWREGRARHTGMRDDHACMAHAALALHEATGASHYIEHATRWVQVLDEHFLDERSGAYYFTADDAEALIVRTLDLGDNAAPNGNGVMIGVLSRLWRLTGDAAWRERLDTLAGAFATQMTKNFFPVTTAMNAMAFDMAALDIVIAGGRDDPATDALVAAAGRHAGPDRLLQIVDPGAGALPDNHPAHGKGPVDGKPAAYVCRGMVCGLPITDPEALARELRGG